MQGKRLKEDSILRGHVMQGKRLKEELIMRQTDPKQPLCRCSEKAPIVAQVQELVGWLRLWDTTMEYGAQHVRGLQMLSRQMAHHGKGRRLCPLCEASDSGTSMVEDLDGERQ